MTSTTTLEKILQDFHGSGSVKISNRETTNEIINKIINDGPSNLQIATDFDFTLTRSNLNGQTCDTCQGLLVGSHRMADGFKKDAERLYARYHPIEIDPTMSLEEKTGYMMDWYKGFQASLSSFHMEKSMIKTMVEESNAFLRDNTKEMLSILNEAEVPVLIFSGGIGDVLEEILHKHGAWFPNLKVISNYMIFDEKETLRGFKEPIIHPCNKNEKAATHAHLFTPLQDRGNVILLGDAIGDVEMTSGNERNGVTLKIGFLNEMIDTRLDSFMDNFDIVLVNDQSMDFVNLILWKILGKN